MIGISAVTLWRWRHDPSMGFPTAKRINGRTFFAWDEIAAWLDKQPNVA
jgi:predicted DNA-binding transcriptional regulator AlpA